MSTKIFPFIPRKIKPLKPPDPQIDQLFQVEKAASERALAQHKERRKIMADLYAEDLERRAKLLVKNWPLCPCCGEPMSKYTAALVKQKLDKA